MLALRIAKVSLDRRHMDSVIVRITFVISRHNRSSRPRALHTVYAFSTIPSFSSFILIPPCHPLPPRMNHNPPSRQRLNSYICDFRFFQIETSQPYHFRDIHQHRIADRDSLLEFDLAAGFT